MECVTELLELIEEKDLYTTIHSKEVANISVLFAKRLQFSEDKIKLIRNAALLHDVGKTEISKKILNKKTVLNKKERATIVNHAILGAKKIEMEYPELKELAPLIRHHHESWNGTGYPSRLSCNEIPIESQIISIADSYHAILGRCYSKKCPPHEACKILLNGAGSQWNPYLIFKFVKFIMSNST